MSEKSVTLTDDGQEIQQQDFNLAFATAGLADDRVLAELLRITPYDGTNVFKGIIPYSTSRTSRAMSSTAPVVVPSGSANGSIVVNPFRAVVGSRNAASGSPPTNPTSDTDALANWRDVRSGIFTGSATALSETVAIAANSSGNPRWDLVYAQISPDVGQNSQVRRVKDPTSGSLSTPSVPQYNGSPVAVFVVAGTPGSSPALPALPADAAGNYCIPLAYIRVPNGFSGTSTVLDGDIRAATLAHDGATPTSQFRTLAGGKIRPASGNNDSSGTYATRGFPWSAGSAGVRPGPFMSPDWVGGEEMIVELDLLAGSSSGWSHNSLDVVDDSVDWRNRVFPVITVQATLTNNFANDNASGSTTSRCPLGTGNANLLLMGNTCGIDGLAVASNATVALLTNSNLPAITAGAIVGLYADAMTGALKVFIQNLPGVRLFIYLKATAPYPNL